MLFELERDNKNRGINNNYETINSNNNYYLIEFIKNIPLNDIQNNEIVSLLDLVFKCLSTSKNNEIAHCEEIYDRLKSRLNKIIEENLKQKPSKELEHFDPEYIKNRENIEIVAKVTKVLKKENLFNEITFIVSDAVNEIHKNSKLNPPTAMLFCSETFKLCSIETNILSLLFCVELHDEAYTLIKTRYKNNRSHMIDAISEYLKIEKHTCKYYLANKNKLFKYNLIETSISISQKVSLTESAIKILKSNDVQNLIYEIATPAALDNTYDLESFQVSNEQIELLTHLIKSGQKLNILIHGPGGTGKTEITRALAHKTKKELFINRIIDEEGDDNIHDRKTQLYTLSLNPLFTGKILLIDESDSILNTPSFNRHMLNGRFTEDKAWINSLLDESINQMIFITNHITSIDQSTLRRFNYILEFKNLNKSQRLNNLHSLCKKENISFLSNKTIDFFAAQKNLQIGHLSLALKSVKNLNIQDNEKERFFFSILESHLSTTSQNNIDLKSLNRAFSLEGLNTSIDINSFVQNMHELKQRNLKINSSFKECINILISGPSGVGKTEFVKYLSVTLEKELVIKRPSDIFSKYVGESESNIMKIFQEAEENDQILFLDEADSFFYAREMAQRSWEVSFVNQFLTCMENFKGILVCATNFEKNLDTATLRRFLYKIKFDYLDHKGIELFYNKFFNDIHASELDLSSLKNLYGLTPGDFHNVKRKMSLYTDIKFENIFFELAEELKCKKDRLKKPISIN